MKTKERKEVPAVPGENPQSDIVSLLEIVFGFNGGL